jgi:phosphate transport system protein
MKRHFDADIIKLKETIIQMGSLTETQIADAMTALKTRNMDLALATILKDQETDNLELIVDELGIQLLALRQPMAKDLRFITTAMRLSNELERMADLAVNICQRTMEIGNMPELKKLIDMPKLSDVAIEMVKLVIDSFINLNATLAQKVLGLEPQANALRTRIIQELIYDYMIKDGTTAPRAVPLLLVARDLERICDHAVNMAEDIIYMITAHQIRHHHDEIKNIHLGDDSNALT